MNIQKTIEYIQGIEEIDESEKKELIQKLERGQDPSDVLELLKEKIQQKINAIFDKAGVKIDENDPEYKAKHQKMMDEIKKAEKEFERQMNQIEKEIDRVQIENLKKDEKERLKKVRSKINV